MLILAGDRAGVRVQSESQSTHCFLLESNVQTQAEPSMVLHISCQLHRGAKNQETHRPHPWDPEPSTGRDQSQTLSFDREGGSQREAGGGSGEEPEGPEQEHDVIHLPCLLPGRAQVLPLLMGPQRERYRC